MNIRISTLDPLRIQGMIMSNRTGSNTCKVGLFVNSHSNVTYDDGAVNGQIGVHLLDAALDDMEAGS